MKITTNNTNISFEKTLIAKGAYLKHSKPKPCYIYKLDKNEDVDYFRKLRSNNDWWDNYFVDSLSFSLYRNHLSREREARERSNEVDKSLSKKPVNKDLDGFYVVEDKKKNCIGYMELYLSDLSYLETCPIYSKENKKRNVKFIGETMMTFLAELKRQNNQKSLDIPNIRENTEGFYINNCYCSATDIPRFYSLKEKDFDTLIQQNKEHTKHKIKFV